MEASLRPIPRLLLEGVTKAYGQPATGAALPVLNGISFAAGKGEFLVVVGPNGCGKTTLVNIIAGLTAGDAGRVLVDGRTVTGPGPDRAVVFQGLALFEWMTARDNVAFGLKARGISKAERRRLADCSLERVRLGGFGDAFPYQLSGGMRQRLALARVIAVSPMCMLLDEPLAALDYQLRRAMQQELAVLCRDCDRTVIMVTHDLDEAVYLADRIVVLTSRPARVSEILTVDLPHAGEGRQRHAPRFQQLKEHLWERLSQ